MISSKNSQFLLEFLQELVVLSEAKNNANEGGFSARRKLSMSEADKRGGGKGRVGWSNNYKERDVCKLNLFVTI